ncbi:hypothetical protein [Coxiella-like endosymbiont of Rhipicephalus sanguineus]|uniref:hypothetical protein n=1 Tax=Coxiella-like endosymbiont of Rhipicephalus sanguineus TaxID=1955402 RepID=UPI00203DD416|nr:hypothetical protein [Coxiella-like endosymbiont of Rhipicephalus sanguineus]
MRILKLITISYLGRWGFPQRSLDLPSVARQGNFSSASFLSCGELGFYPIFDSVEWVRKLLTWGIRTIQLRIKKSKVSAY